MRAGVFYPLQAFALFGCELCRAVEWGEADKKAGQCYGCSGKLVTLAVFDGGERLDPPSSVWVDRSPTGGR